MPCYAHYVDLCGVSHLSMFSARGSSRNIVPALEATFCESCGVKCKMCPSDLTTEVCHSPMGPMGRTDSKLVKNRLQLQRELQYVYITVVLSWIYHIAVRVFEKQICETYTWCPTRLRGQDCQYTHILLEITEQDSPLHIDDTGTILLQDSCSHFCSLLMCSEDLEQSRYETFSDSISAMIPLRQ